MLKKETIVHWFRKGLRIHDNPALIECCELIKKHPDKYVLRPIFILDPNIKDWMNVGPNRFRFLQESLKDLNNNLKSINSKLYVIRGHPEMVFQRIFVDWNVIKLTFENDIEPYSKKRDSAIEIIAFENGVKIKQHYSHTIYNPELILQKNSGKAPMTYQKFLSLATTIKIADPLEVPDLLPDSSKPDKDFYEIHNDEVYNPPELTDLIREGDLNKISYKFPGGETEALRRLDEYINNTEYIIKFEKPKTSPNSLEPSTTVLSPYLKFGCLSSRLFHKQLNKILMKNPKHTKPPVSLLGQLLWREFYYTAAAAEPKFNKMKGNSMCIQINWSLSYEDNLNAWKNGATGYPFIDAIMRQLQQEGWIHHLARHAVACFLTRGDLWISWEEGQKVFEEFLLDADWALNAGNWMWLSASAFYYQYIRVYSPVAFGKKTDPNGKYIRKYCPELKNYPSDVIYEPWKVPNNLQQQYGCVIGKDYPKRIVIHEDVYKENIGKMSQAYKINRQSKGLVAV